MALAFACREPWWPTQDGDQAKRLGITLVLGGQVAMDVERDLCPNRTTLNRVLVSSREFAYSLLYLFTYRIMFPHLLSLAYLYLPS